jgi:hypothetical protein
MNTATINKLGAVETRGFLYLNSLEVLAYVRGGGKKCLDGFFWLDADKPGVIMFRPTGSVSTKKFVEIPNDGDILYFIAKAGR